MRGGDDVVSRMRVAAAACLVSSGLFVGGVPAAVALADPGAAGDAAGAGTAGGTSTESTGQPGRSASPTGGSAGTVSTGGQGAVGPRTAALPDDPYSARKGVADPDGSKLSEGLDPGSEAQAGEPLGEQVVDPAAADEIPGEQEGKEEEDEEEEDEDECGWAWWPLPPDDDVVAPDNGDGYGGGTPSATPPAGRPGGPPGIQIPQLPESPLVPVVPDPLDPLPGLVEPEAMPVVSMPIIVLPPVAPAIGAGGGGAPRAPAGAGTARPPAVPRGTPPERPAAPRASDAAVPASYRAGYGEYLRTAGMPQVIAVAVPGATGIMLLTGAGGLIGYRQARAGHAIRASASRRFSS